MKMVLMNMSLWKKKIQTVQKYMFTQNTKKLNQKKQNEYPQKKMHLKFAVPQSISLKNIKPYHKHHQILVKQFLLPCCRQQRRNFLSLPCVMKDATFCLKSLQKRQNGSNGHALVTAVST